LEKEFASDVICPVNSISMKKEAYLDYNLEKDKRVGLMGCYCKEYAIENNKDWYDMTFEELVAPGTKVEGEDYKYCK
jgi:hypothetical protein